jgi:hypothetical protein
MSSSELIPAEIRKLRAAYRERREQTLLDAASSAISLNTILTADETDFDAITPQMREAFGLAFPGNDLHASLSEIAGAADNAAEVTGFLNNWRGKYFEVLVRDRLNSGETVGDLTLGAGQTAVLATDISQPGWDLQILSADGLPVSEVQLKASSSLAYVKDALETYPSIEVLATDEVAEQIISDSVSSSGISNTDLQDEIKSPLDTVIDSPLEDIAEMLGHGLPVLVVVGTEGTMWLTGRQTLENALSRSANRLVKTGASMGVGGLLSLVGLGVVSLPASALTRIAMARYDTFNMAQARIRANADRVRGLGGIPAA